MQESTWYYLNGSDRQGPVSSDDMRAKILAGDIRADTMVWASGMADWAPLNRSALAEWLPAGSNPPPPPTPATPEETFWRDDKYLVVRRDFTELPPRCIRTNAELPREAMRTKTFYYTSPWVLLTFFLSIIVLIIVALATRKAVKLSLGLCSAERKKRRLWLLGAWIGFFACASLFVYGIATEDASPAGAWAILVSMPAALVCLGIASRFSADLHVRKVRGDYAWLTGAGEPFLASLPDAGSRFEEY
ncbi:MAG: DUF4339 domain-containing protein [Verrucomicrobiota bacterium JB022]|nr:DUF4339 domain-containing protein [Verrucomicrobiota bacterium JB022]